MRIVEKFNTWNALLKRLKKVSTAQRLASRRIGDGHWSGTSTWEEAVKLLHEGWHDGEANARKLSKAIVAKIGSMVERDEPIYDVEGSGVDVSLYVKNVPECWMRHEQ